MTFYNTILLSESDHRIATKEAKSQEREIYELMKGGGEWTATSINEYFPHWIKTSIRRCLTDLNADDKIERLRFVPGPNKRDEGLYRVRKQGRLF